jgi:anti-sigma factor RsiW
MTAFDHPDAVQRLDAYANGSLPEAEHQAVAAHIAACDGCAAEVEAWQAIAAATPADQQTAEAAGRRALAAVWDQLDDQPAADPTPAEAAAQPETELAETEPESGTEEPAWYDRRRPRRLQWAKLSAAAAVLVLVAVAVLSGGLLGTGPRDALAAAAAKTRTAGSASLQVSGQTTLTVDGQALPTPAEDETPQVAVKLAGQGAVAFGQALRLSVDITTTDSPVEAVADGRLQTVVVDGAYYTAEDGQPWQLTGGASGLFSAALLSSDTPQVLLDSAAGDITDLGTTELDGVEVRHLRFELQDGVLGPARADELDHTAEVWIATDDNTLRQFTIRSQGPVDDDAIRRWQSTITVALSDFGVATDIQPPQIGATPSASPGGDR